MSIVDDIYANSKTELDSRLIKKLTKEIEAIQNDELTLEELKNKNKCKIEKNEKGFVVFQKQCYYGGCDFDEAYFGSEYEAYKHGCLTTLSKKMETAKNKTYAQHGNIVEINKRCKKYLECADII